MDTGRGSGNGSHRTSCSSLSFLHQTKPDYKQQIFTADEPEIESLPRDRITSFLSSIDRGACEGYLEYIIWTLGEKGGEFHDTLAELYMVDSRVKVESGAGVGAEAGARAKAYDKLLAFLNDSTHYRPYRVMNKLSGKGTFSFLFFSFLFLMVDG